MYQGLRVLHTSVFYMFIFYILAFKLLCGNGDNSVDNGLHIGKALIFAFGGKHTDNVCSSRYFKRADKAVISLACRAGLKSVYIRAVIFAVFVKHQVCVCPMVCVTACVYDIVLMKPRILSDYFIFIGEL